MLSNRTSVSVACGLATVALLALLFGCAHRVLSPELHPAGDVPVAPVDFHVLKVHMRSGELYVLDSWQVDHEGNRLEGSGVLYAIGREELTRGPVSINMAEVALFETNRPDAVREGGSGLLAFMTTVTGAVSVYCLANPKSCFGSCPTFYLEGGDPDRPAAEGFSASFARALEARDVDALPGAWVAGERVVVTMRNEALETHAVRRVRLLVAPRSAGARVLAGVDGRFYPTQPAPPARACRAPEGDCLGSVAAPGGAERYSAADPHDLATRETVELDFPSARGRLGLSLAARQTLLSTHLFYRSLGFFGSRAGEHLAMLERGGPVLAARATGMARLLGGIEAEVAEDGGEWRAIGTFDEAGPIASDVQALPFETRGDGPLRVRLRMAKGHWRLDHVGLVSLGVPVEPRAVLPRAVERGPDSDPGALDVLRREEGHLVTVPGDAYRLVFEVPELDGELDLFLESEGYYYEWMREEWLAEEDAAMAALVLSNPAEALRRMAGRFKQHEPEMERAFWASRYRR